MSVDADTPSGDNFQGSLLNNKQTHAELIPVFHYKDRLYHQYFGWFLQHTNEKERIWDWFSQELLPQISTRDVLIDAGAGNGELLSHFSPKFHQCIAIEPNPAFANNLLKFIPDKFFYQTTIIGAPGLLPKANLVVASHVKYYIPSEEWKINTDRLISWLAPGSCLVEIFESIHSDFQRMRREFLGREYVRELQHFAWQYSRQKNIEVKVDTREAWVTCTSLEIMLGIAIFMMNDLAPEILSNHPGRPTCEQLAQWIHQNYYSSDGVYRMYCTQDFMQYFPR